MLEPLDEDGALLLEESLNEPALGEDRVVDSLLSDEAKVLGRASYRLLAKAQREGRISSRFRELLGELLELASRDEEPDYGYEKPKRKPVTKAEDLVAEVHALGEVDPERVDRELGEGTYAAYSRAVAAGVAVASVEKAAPWRGGPVCVEIAKRAEQLIRKSSKPLDTGEAMLAVLEADPDLALAYRKEIGCTY